MRHRVPVDLDARLGARKLVLDVDGRVLVPQARDGEAVAVIGLDDFVPEYDLVAALLAVSEQESAASVHT